MELDNVKRCTYLYELFTNGGQHDFFEEARYHWCTPHCNRQLQVNPLTILAGTGSQGTGEGTGEGVGEGTGEGVGDGTGEGDASLLT